MSPLVMNGSRPPRAVGIWAVLTAVHPVSSAARPAIATTRLLDMGVPSLRAREHPVRALGKSRIPRRAHTGGNIRPVSQGAGQKRGRGALVALTVAALCCFAGNSLLARAALRPGWIDAASY